MKTSFLIPVPEVITNKPTHVDGWFVSEIPDGEFCIWDGGLTRGVPLVNLGFDVDPRLLSFGIWFHGDCDCWDIPDWFLNQLPNIPLCGFIDCATPSFSVVSSPLLITTYGQVYNSLTFPNAQRELAWLHKNLPCDINLSLLKHTQIPKRPWHKKLFGTGKVDVQAMFDQSKSGLLFRAPWHQCYKESGWLCWPK